MGYHGLLRAIGRRPDDIDSTATLTEHTTKPAWRGSTKFYSF